MGAAAAMYRLAVTGVTVLEQCCCFKSMADRNIPASQKVLGTSQGYVILGNADEASNMH